MVRSFVVRSLAFLVLAAAARATTVAWAAGHPHVIVVLADDAGAGDFSFTGNTNLATPVIDGLARDGASLERFFVQPVCAPTRAEFLTGRWHQRGGVRGVSLGQERLDPGERTIAEVFRAAGYATGCIGKWHLGTQGPHHPRARGFDHFVGFTEGHWGDYFDPPLEENGTFVTGTGFIADVIAEKTVAFIDDCRRTDPARPFFCHVAFNTPHSPMDVPDADWDRFRDRPVPLRGSAGANEDLPFTRAALAMVENLDRNLGRILAALDRHGIADDTIVVFFSDNGANSPRWCRGLRGRKGTVDEGGVQSVCCLRWPGRIAAGTRIDSLAGAIDLLPTLAGLAGVPIAAPRPLDGLDLSPLLLASDGAAAIAERAQARPLFAAWNGRVSVRTADHRLDGNGRLYDMRADPGQTTDLAESHAAERARLQGLVEAFTREVTALQPRLLPERFFVGHPAWPRTELPARDGAGQGGIVRSGRAPNASHFTRWTAPADAITWTVDVVTAGRYEAVLWYTCPPADAGATVRLSALPDAGGDRADAPGGGAPVTATITPGWDPPANRGDDRVERDSESFEKEFRPLSLGTIDLAAGPQTLRLEAVAIPGRSVADVRRLVLVPRP
ncbi:MAG: N-acetylgalactosamine 6-sulfate sulfatase [Planctomycetia bacterium]|nr:N-acetylgalactosamine 6-sulfate sulfatase [Planctomycetia bacterium]